MVLNKWWYKLTSGVINYLKSQNISQIKSSITAGSKRRCQVHRFQVSGVRCEVPGVTGQVPGVRCQVPNARLQVSGARFHVPRSMLQVPGARKQVARDIVPGFRDQVPRQNVENFHIKNVLRLNGNYKLILRLNGNYELTNTFFTTLIFYFPRFRKTMKKTQLSAMSLCYTCGQKT